MIKRTTKLLPLSLAFLLGMLCIHHFNAFGLLPLLCIGVFWAAGFFLLMRRRLSLRKIWPGMLFIPLFLIFGGLNEFSSRPLPDNHVSKLTGQEISLEFKTISSGKSTRRGAKVSAEAICFSGLSEQEIQGKFMVYFPDEIPCPTENQRYSARIDLKDLSGTFPGYREYLESQGILAMGFARELTFSGTESSLISSQREHLAGELYAEIGDREVAGLMTSLLLGDRSGLAKDTRENFSRVGIAHFLAISGMHLGILFLVLDKLFLWLPIRAKFSRYRHLLLILIMVAYALLSGAGPAVCRAGFMLSVLCLGRFFHLRSQGMNLLSATALVLLIWNPAQLYSLGFQLSFAAVTGIMLSFRYFSEKVAWLLPFLPKILRDNLALSIAAQLATTPLTCWHFGEFPVYFLLSNLVLCIPMALILQAGMLGLFLEVVAGIGKPVFWLIEMGVPAFLKVVEIIGNLPGAVATEFSFSDPGFRNLCLMLFAIGLMIVLRFAWDNRSGMRNFLGRIRLPNKLVFKAS